MRLKPSFNIIKRLKRVISESPVENSEYRTLPSPKPRGPFGRLSQIGLNNSRPIFSDARLPLSKSVAALLTSC